MTSASVAPEACALMEPPMPKVAVGLVTTAVYVSGSAGMAEDLSTPRLRPRFGVMLTLVASIVLCRWTSAFPSARAGAGLVESHSATHDAAAEYLSQPLFMCPFPTHGRCATRLLDSAVYRGNGVFGGSL